MKKSLKQMFQSAAGALAILSTENHVFAMESAGIAFDNLSSGLTVQNLKKFFSPKP